MYVTVGVSIEDGASNLALQYENMKCVYLGG